MALAWFWYGDQQNSDQRRELHLLDTTFHVPKSMHDSAIRIIFDWARRSIEEGKGMAGRALQAPNYCYVFDFVEDDHPIR